MENAEICSKVVDEQHGSKKNHQVSLLSLNKCLIGDIFRLLRVLACYRMIDAIGCFDRINHTPAIISLMQFGLDYSTVHTLFQVMQKSLHCIKTGYGTLEPVYGDETVPLAGSGQGNGLGPTLWALISTVILIRCKRDGHGMKSITSITKLPIYFMGYLFVDDSDIVQGSDDVNTSGESLLPDFQEFMRQWNSSIRASGGAVCPKKTK